MTRTNCLITAPAVVVAMIDVAVDMALVVVFFLFSCYFVGLHCCCCCCCWLFFAVAVDMALVAFVCSCYLSFLSSVAIAVVIYCCYSM